MKKIYLHVGTPKTGSTAIQYFLKMNNERLQAQDFVYPLDIVSEENWGNYYKSGGNIEKIINSPTDDFQKAMQMKEVIDQYPQNIILSCEVITNSIAQNGIGLLRELKDICANHEIHIIVYLRPQIEVYESYYAEFVKYWNFALDMEDFWDKHRIRILNYQEILQRILEVIPEENVHVRIYDRSNWVHQDVCFDFADCIELDVHDFQRVGSDINFSVDNLTLEVKKAINKVDCDETDIQKIFFQSLLSAAENNKKSGKNQYFASHFSDTEREAFMKQWENGNQWIANKFFAKTRLFDSKPETEVFAYTDKEFLDDAIYIFTKALLKQNEQIDKLQDLFIQCKLKTQQIEDNYTKEVLMLKKYIEIVREREYVLQERFKQESEE
jgi:hypothetical protein